MAGGHGVRRGRPNLSGAGMGVGGAVGLLSRTKAHGSGPPAAFPPTEEVVGVPTPLPPHSPQGNNFFWPSRHSNSTLLYAGRADVTALPRAAVPGPPLFPACAAVRLLALGFGLSPQDGGHNEPASLRLALRRLRRNGWQGLTVRAQERCTSRRERRRRPDYRPPFSSPPARRPPRPGRPLGSQPVRSPARRGAPPRPCSAAAAMKLTDSVLRSFRVAKVFRENSDKINCFDFSPNGETVISSSDDDSIVLYDCQEGK